MCSRSVSVVLLFLVCVGLVQCQAEGESCIVDSTGESGVCKNLVQCPRALEDLKRGVYPAKVCGYVGYISIVCCTSGNAPNTPKPTTPPTRTPTTRSTRRPTSRKTAPPTTTTAATTIRFTGAVGEKSQIKCIEYAKAVYTRRPSSSFLPNAPDEIHDNCAADFSDLIVGGTECKPKEFPHMALVGYDGSEGPVYKCGGALISEKYVLTAGHCLFDRESGSYAKYIRLGELEQNSDRDDADPQDFTVKEIVRHPDYKPTLRYNDIALLELDRTVKFSGYIRPACLHTKEEVNRNIVVATGWGNTDFTGDGSDHLLKVKLNEFTLAQCNQTYKSSDRRLPNGIVDTQYCAGSASEKKDACQGDSGGPLQILNREPYCTYNIIGVTSFGKSCGIINVPGVYTKVSRYVGWIESVVWPTL